MKLKQRRIVPAVLTDSPKALAAMLQQVEAFAEWVQIDIMDGLFVPSLSITSQDIASQGIKMDWEAHLMVREPEKSIESFYLAGAKRIVVHYEAVKDTADDVVQHITSLGIKAGLAINPETPITVLGNELVSRLGSVLFLSVHPGFYGANFIPEVLEKISEFRRFCPDVSIGIDGGINEDNITQVAQSGVDEICVGSAIFRQPDPDASFRKLTVLARTGWDIQNDG